MRALNRRRFLVVIGGSVAGVGIGAQAMAAPSQTLWMLDPDWGFPLTTETGSDTKLRCHGHACHRAAPHRFFLTEADARAGRLHLCCLAQPVPVSVCIDLNELMPYYRARRGGVDARCPELPATLRSALYAASTCIASTAPDTPIAPPDPAPPGSAPADPDAPPPARADNDVPDHGTAADHAPAARSTTLPVTGVATTPAVLAGAVLTATGVAALIARGGATSEDRPQATGPAPQCSAPTDAGADTGEPDEASSPTG